MAKQTEIPGTQDKDSSVPSIDPLLTEYHRAVMVRVEASSAETSAKNALHAELLANKKKLKKMGPDKIPYYRRTVGHKRYTFQVQDSIRVERENIPDDLDTSDIG
jgi:hypothetical protein